MERFSTLQQNVREICMIEEEALKSRSSAERFGDFVAQRAGSAWFVVLHIFWFSAWALLNSGELAAVRPFDPFPYPFLTLVVSPEHESSKTLELLQALCAHHRLPCSQDPELAELIARTKPADILQELKSSLPTDDGGPPSLIIS
jgi:hypothetical protein